MLCAKGAFDVSLLSGFQTAGVGKIFFFVSSRSHRHLVYHSFYSCVDPSSSTISRVFRGHSCFICQTIGNRHSCVFSSVEFVIQEAPQGMQRTQINESGWNLLLQKLLPLFDRVYFVVDTLDEVPWKCQGWSRNFSQLTSESPSAHVRRTHSTYSTSSTLILDARTNKDIELVIRQEFKESPNLASLLFLPRVVPFLYLQVTGVPPRAACRSR